jgi:hypothetical protein
MKPLPYLLLPLVFLLSSSHRQSTTCQNGEYILTQSIKLHDPHSNWQKASFDMVIREPRLSTPGRFSNVQLDMSTGAFRLERDRDNHVSTHIVDASGQPSTLLDGKKEADPELIEKYRLQPARNSGYKAYYEFMYGLPMVLNEEGYTMKTVSETAFEGQKAVSIDFELATPMIASSWRVFFSANSYRLLGLETLGDKPDEGEYLVFNGQADIEKLLLPRFRHWYNKQTDEYLGSDILVSYK